MNPPQKSSSWVCLIKLCYIKPLGLSDRCKENEVGGRGGEYNGVYVVNQGGVKPPCSTPLAM